MKIVIITIIIIIIIIIMIIIITILKWMGLAQKKHRTLTRERDVAAHVWLNACTHLDVRAFV